MTEDENEVVKSLEELIKETKDGNLRGVLMTFIVTREDNKNTYSGNVCLSTNMLEAKVLNFNAISLVDSLRKDIISLENHRDSLEVH